MIVATIMAVTAGIVCLAGIASVGWSVVKSDDGGGLLGGLFLGLGSGALFLLAADMTGLI